MISTVEPIPETRLFRDRGTQYGPDHGHSHTPHDIYCHLVPETRAFRHIQVAGLQDNQQVIKMQLELSENTVLELCTFAYDRWSKAYDNLKLIRKEQPDGSQDWKLFHQARLESATVMLDNYKKVLDEISKYNPIRM